MRVLLVSVAILALLLVAVGSGSATLLGSALAVHKRGKAGKKSKDTGDIKKLKDQMEKSKKTKVEEEGSRAENVAHNAMTKIKVAKNPTGTKTTKEVANSLDERERSAADDKAIAKKQDSFNNGMQMATSVLTMVASRMVFKIDYKNARTVLLCRLAFCAYVVLSQVLFWFLARQVEKRDDHTLLPQSVASNPLQAAMGLLGPKLAGAHPAGAMLGSVLSMAGAGEGKGTVQTVKQHDLAEVKKLASSMLFELLAATYMHFISKSTSQLLMIPLMGITGKLKAPIVQIHLLRMRPVGTLQRPFKSGIETMLGAMSGAQGSAGATVPSAAEQQSGAKGDVSDESKAGDSAKDSDVIDLDAEQAGVDASAKSAKSSSSNGAAGTPRPAVDAVQSGQVRSADRQGRDEEQKGSEEADGEEAEEADGDDVGEGGGEKYDAAELLEAVDRLGEVVAP